MTGFLVITVLVLLAIAIWQMTKIFDLTQIKTHSDNSQLATDKDNTVNGYLMFAFLVGLYILTIYSLIAWGHLVLLGDSSSEHGKEVDTLMAISLVIIFIVQFITQALLYYFSFKYRGKQGKKALYFADNDKLEAIWTVIPVIVLAVLIIYGLFSWVNIMYVDENEEVIYVELYAKQFNWEARYAGKDNVLGKANVRYIEGINTMGIDASDPYAQDDIVVNELHLPVGKKVVFKMRSQDVMHSAYMPHFRAQMNCVPGMVTQFAFIPTVTTAAKREEKAIVEKIANINKIRSEKSKELIAKGESPLDPYEFDYLLLCNKICGASHYNMQMKIVVETQEEYDKWINGKVTFGSAMEQQKASKQGASDTTVITQVIQ